MLSAMLARRVPSLALALALVAAALIATAWSSRRAVIGAFESVRDGQAFAVQQSVRADLADLGGPPTAADLDAIVRDRGPDGLRYLALLDGRGRAVAEAGAPIGERPRRAVSDSGTGERVRGDRTGIRIEHAGNRIRIELRAAFRRAWGTGSRPWWIVMEVEPAQAATLRDTATRTLWVGALAALVLFGIAAWLVRNGLAHRARERERERERRLASLGEMSAVLAHEIRNPLASLKGNAQLLAASLPAGDKPRAKAERVVEEAVRLERLTQDLLAFVRTGELARAPVAPAEVVREAAAAVGGDIAIDVEAAPATWSLDAARIREVMVNLLDNAVAAGPPARASARIERGRLVLEVVDHGPGVRAEDRDKVFEPFFTNKTRGTGLGLAIARRVIEAHRGTIRVEDAPDGGARFIIEIPEA
jgi:two-component system, NtrC family, sensor histidine kinase HydH